MDEHAVFLIVLDRAWRCGGYRSHADVLRDVAGRIEAGDHEGDVEDAVGRRIGRWSVTP